METRNVILALDNDTIALLQQTAEQLSKPQSHVVREAIRQYHDRVGDLSEPERLRMIKIVEEMMSLPPTRPQHEVDRELRAIRRARRSGGRLSGQETSK